MGVCFKEEFCYFPPARTGSHSVNSVLKQLFGKDYTPFGKLPARSIITKANLAGFFEWGGDHTRATMIHKLIPQTSQFQSVSSFRDPLERVASIYSYTSEQLGLKTSIEGLDEWVRYVFCNKYNDLWLAHGLQTSIFLDSRSVPCVTRVYETDRLAGLLEFLAPGHCVTIPQVNRSNERYFVSDLKASTQRLLLDRVLPDLEFWDSLRLLNGCYIF